jgi:hypothetical protein
VVGNPSLMAIYSWPSVALASPNGQSGRNIVTSPPSTAASRKRSEYSPITRAGPGRLPMTTRTLVQSRLTGAASSERRQAATSSSSTRWSPGPDRRYS